MDSAAAAPPSADEEEVWRRQSTDCIYYLASPLTCKKASECEYHHSDAARLNLKGCWYWFNGNCANLKCSFRHQVSEPLGIGQTFLVSQSLLQKTCIQYHWTLTNDIRLHGVIWPGQTVEKPRALVFPYHGKFLRIGVPLCTSYNGPEGFCFIWGWIGNPSYSDLVQKVSENYYDAAIGDIAFLTNRTRLVDFTQPCTESGLIIVAPARQIKSNAWAFLKPFAVQMWCVLGLLFLFVGSAIWIIEHLGRRGRRRPRLQAEYPSQASRRGH